MCFERECQTVAHAQLGVDRRQMVLDRLFLHPQPAGDLPIRVPAGDGAGDLALPRRQPVEHGAVPASGLARRYLRRTVISSGTRRCPLYS